MPTQIGQLGVTFPDATLQTTAAVPGAPGFGIPNMSVITSSSFWTVPAGVTRIRVTVVGGGGGADVDSGATGGTSAFGTYCSATGGGRGSKYTGPGAGGTGIGGTLNISGGYGLGGGGDVNGNGFSCTLAGGNSIFGINSYGSGAAGSLALAPVDYFTYNYGSAGGGGTAIKIITGLTPGTSISVTVGAGGYLPLGGSGNAGVVIVEY